MTDQAPGGPVSTRTIALPELPDGYQWHYDREVTNGDIYLRISLYRTYRLFKTKAGISRRIVLGEWFKVPISDEETQTAVLHMNCDIIRLEASNSVRVYDHI